MKKAFYLIAGIMALSAPNSVQAQSELPVSENQSPSREHLEASYRLLDSVNYTEQMTALIAPLGLTFFNEGLDQSATRNGVELEDGLKTKLRKAFVEELDKIVEEFARDTRIEAGLIYAKYFTIGELNRLIKINQDPVMVKSVKIAPDLQGELAKLGMENMRKYQPQMEQRMKEITEEYLADILDDERS